MLDMFNVCIYLILLGTYQGLVSCNIIIAKTNEVVTLRCPFQVTTEPVIWLGPGKGKLTTYSVGNNMNYDVIRHGHISLEGNHLRGEYNLKILNFTKDDSGEYMCQSIVNGSVVQKIFFLRILEKPKSVRNNEKIVITTQVGKPAIIEVLVESVQKPFVSWTDNSGGKLGSWTSKQNGILNFLLSSTVVPTAENQYETYGVKVRNEAGSLDLKLEIQIIDFPVIIKPHEVRCNASTRSTINCYLRQEHADDWESTWIHSRNDRFVSEITGHIEGNISSIEINYCDYREEGKYKCTWKSATSEYSATAIVMAYGPPTLISKAFVVKENMHCLAVQLYSTDNSITVRWFQNDTEIKDRRRMKKEYSTTVVNLTFSDKLIAADGFLSELCVSNFNKKDITIYNSQIRNNYGSIEATFPKYWIQQRYTKILINDDSTTMQMFTTDKFKRKIETDQPLRNDSTLHFIIGTAGFIMMILFVIAGVYVFKHFFGKAEVYQRRIRPSTNDLSIEAENAYEEIRNSQIIFNVEAAASQQIRISENLDVQTEVVLNSQIENIIDVEQSGDQEMDETKSDYHFYIECI